MAAKIIIPLEVQSNIQKEIANAKLLKEQLQEASKLRIPAPVLAARQGVAAATTGPRAPKSGYSPADKKESQDYGVSRSMGAGTGAEGRDFAKQAQGLGGLVHVYATFAANLFAVSAAFGALSRAADTTNMVKGLDQLGASSGRSLGSLSKQLSMVTDGAISLRDAMTATAQASAGGMTDAAILRMGAVAKQASQALGIAMPDAISRLSRGITKLEPELLDEIGIMVRVDKTTQDYALTLGKAASALTDFEKRQGFANAVLEQGEKKFGSIKMDANPYAKILASMENLAQSGLELVNKVLSPLLSILSSSPTALAAAMAAIGAALLKQAVPALGMMRSNSKALEEQSLRNLQRITKDSRARVELADTEAGEIGEKEFRAKQTTLNKIAALQKTRVNKEIVGTEVSSILKKSVFDQTAEDKRAIAAKHTELLNSESEFHQKQAINLEKYTAKSKSLDKGLADAHENAQSKLEVADSSRYSHRMQMEANLNKAMKSASNDRILATVSETAAIEGPVRAWRKLNSEIAKSKAGTQVLNSYDDKGSIIGTDAINKTDAMSNGLVRLKGAVSIAASAVSTAANAFSGILFYVGLAVAGFQLLSSWLSTNSKEFDKFSSSLTLVSDASENMSRTLAAIISKDPLEVFSVASVQAKANALQSISDGTNTLVKDFYALRAASSWFDKFLDSSWDSIGKGSADKLSTNLAKSIEASLSGLEKGPLKEKAKAALQNILGANVDLSSTSKIEAALRKLSNPEIQSAGTGITKVLQDISREANNTASNLTSVLASFEELSKIVKANMASMQPTDYAGKLGFQMLSDAGKLALALESPLDSMRALGELTKNAQVMSLLPPDTSNRLLEAKKGIDALNKSYGELQQAEFAAEKAMQALKGGGVIKAGQVDQARNKVATVDTLTPAGAQQKAIIDNISKEKAAIEIKMAEMGTKVSSTLLKEFVEVGLNKLQQSLSAAMAEGTITAAKGYLSVLKSAGVGTAADEGKLRLQEIGIQRKILEANFQQAKRIEENNNRLEELSLSLKEATNASQLGGTNLRAAEKAMAEQPGLIIERKNLDDRKRLTSGKARSASEIKEMGIDPKVLASTAAYQAQETAYLSGIAKLNGQAAASKIQSMAEVAREATEFNKKELTREIGVNVLAIERLDTLQAIRTEYDKTLQAKKSELEFTNLMKESEKTRLDLQTSKKIIEAASAYGDPAERVKALEAIKEEIKLNDNKRINSIIALKLKHMDAEQKGLESIRVKKAELAALELNENNAIAQARVSQQQEELTYLGTIGVLSAEQLTKRSAALALDSQSLVYAKELSALEADKAAKMQPLLDAMAKQKQIMGGAKDPATEAQQKELEASYTRQLTTLNLINATKVASITLTAQHKAEQELFAEQMGKMVSITETLTGAFGGVGEAIGKVGQAILQMAKDDEDYLKRKQAILSKQRGTEEGSTEYKAYTKDLIKLEKDKTNAELQGYAKSASAGKKLFGEKTLAYKVLSGIEKAFQIASAALQLKDLAISLGILTTKVAATGVAETSILGIKLASAPAKVAADSPGIFSSFASAAGPYGLVAAAGVVAALVAMAGGGSTSMPEVDMTGLTSEDRQSTQGTGQSWVNGIKTDTGGGVFGDSGAKSTAIVDSLEAIKSNSILGLDYDNKMLKALEKLVDSINSAAKSIYSVQGLRQGTGFGTMEGKTKSSGGFLSSIFGGDTTSTTSIQSAGIQFTGTFKNVMDGVAGSISQYKDVLTQFTESGGWFSDDSSWSTLSRESQALSSTVSNSISEVFRDANSMFLDVAAKIGVASSRVADVISNFDITMPVDIMNLKGDELVTELNAVIGAKLGEAAKQIFSGFDPFRKFGEDYLATVLRVIDASDKVDMALRSIGNTFQTLSRFDISEAMVNAAGSLESFMEQASFFKDSFLTNVEKLAPLQKGVSDELARLGLSTTTTKDQFKALVLAQDLNTLAGRTLYQSLMELAPGFDSMLKLAESIDSEKLSSSNNTLQLMITLLTLQGKATEALNLSRSKELSTMSESDKLLQRQINVLLDANKHRSSEIAIYTALGDSAQALLLTRKAEIDAVEEWLRPAKMYLYAMQDEASQKAKLTTAYTKETAAINSTIASLTTSIKTLAAYKDSLLVGQQTTLTPAERYQETKRQAALVASIATGIASTDAEILAKQDAISKLPSVTSTFLEASRQLYASSEQYTQDFASVLSLLDTTGASLILQQTDSQRQLDVLTTSTSLLGLIEVSTATVATLLQQYLVLQSNTGAAKYAYETSGALAPSVAFGGAFAEGGLARGTVLVGEKGPEIVNFTNPGRVYSNKASNELFNTSELVAEIKALRTEVTQLRKEQQQQTGHLIAANYDANNRNADKVSTATREVSAQAEWKARSMLKVA